MKSFSLEGAETLIPLLDLAIEKLARQGVREICMSMSHRGRLNVLANIVGKRYQDIFREFEDARAEQLINRGDVKYHLGYHNYYETASGQEVHISLGFNPSHLEFVNPVTLGRCRAKQDRFGDPGRHVGVALLIHGDAAFAGEGIVQETLNLSQLAGYQVGGAIHIVVNNQIGFTTTPGESRSCDYATDVAKMLQIPIFHVNGEDPEAVAAALDVALDFRRQFHRDVVIDMYCFRRWGHNEGDEAAYTQPLMYRAIEQRPTVREGYLQHLLSSGEITNQDADELVERRMEILEEEWNAARAEEFAPPKGILESMWEGYMGLEECFVEDIATGVDRERLSSYLQRMAAVPEGFHPHPKLTRLLKHRRAMAEEQNPLDWASAELLALASLAAEGYRVRFSGQDSQRGTFSHRHAVIHDSQNGACYCALQHIADDQAPVEIINSPLSEAGVLGFEYGYSLAFPDALTVWEAQFGDFANAAQVIIDQFIASAEDKWEHLSGLVMLLPHGFEGQGPEHSSARLERFLWLSAEDNIQITIPSTPAQFFHLLRRQVVRRWRKPLVVLTPKSLLRHPKVVSPWEHFTQGRFARVLPDLEVTPEQTRRVLLCSGKIYYELLAEREQRDCHDTAILRLEQLYPLPEAQLRAALGACEPGTPVYWVQEEPENMGAWAFLRFHLGTQLFGRYPFNGITRSASASPATGSGGAHKLEQQEILSKALTTTADMVHRDNIPVEK
jgi:2-oxoglutarate dehydrogenase E1 component